MADFKKLTVDGNTYNVKDAQARSDAASAQNTASAAYTAANLKMPLNGIFIGPVDSKATDSMALGSTAPTSTTTLTAGTGAIQSGISLTAGGAAAIKGNSNVTIDAGSNVIVSSADIDVQTDSGRIYTDDNDIFIQADDYVKLKSGGGYALSNDEIIATRPWVMNQIPDPIDPSPLPLNVPYNFRPVLDINAIKKKVTLVGGTVCWNQLVKATDTSCTVPNGHKYISFLSGIWAVGSSDGSAFTVDGANGDKVFDLTKTFNSLAIADYIYGLGSTDGVAWFRSRFPSLNYPYDPGTLMSVSTDKAVSIGFNQWDEVWELGGIDASTGQNMVSNARIRSTNYNPIIPSTQYYVLTPKPIRVFFYTSSKAFISYVSLSSPPYSATITSPAGAVYLRWADAGDNTTYDNDICINISSAENGKYKPYEKKVYTLGKAELNGLFKLDANNNLYADGDTYEHDGTITRNYEYRAYQAGDESLPDAITDGTNTVVKLVTPTTEQVATFDEEMIIYPDGTEALTDYAYTQGLRDVEIPVGNNTLYERNVITVPAAPITPGQYYLSAYVDNDGNTYYTWEA